MLFHYGCLVLLLRFEFYPWPDTTTRTENVLYTGIMANRKIYPTEVAAQYLALLGVNFDDVYNEKGGRTQTQLSILLGAPFMGKELAANSYKTIKTFNDSTFAKAEENTQSDVNEHYDFAANIENTLTGTISTALMADMVEQNPDQLIKWLPSSADEQDVKHATYYGKTMTIKVAEDRGLATRYGCQCGMELINDDESITVPTEA